MKTTLLSLASLVLMSALAAAPAGAQINPDYVLHFTNHEPYVWKGNIYTLINHSVEGWDPARVTYDGVQRLLDFSHRNHITTIGFLSPYGGPGQQFFKKDELNFNAVSDSGSHMFSFENSKYFLVAGGNASLCLCEFLRDLVRGTSKDINPIRIFIVKDASYDYDGQLSGEAYARAGGHIRGGKINLADVESALENRQDYRDYLERVIIGVADMPFCPGQNFYGVPALDKSQYSFQFFEGVEPLSGVIGTGLRHIQMIMIDSQELEPVLKAYGANRYYDDYLVP